MAPSTPIGAHMSVRGKLAGLPERATDLGAEAVQIFLGNPRGWARTPGDPVAESAFAEAAAARGLTVLIHSAYLINLGSPTELTYTRSIDSIAHAFARGAGVGAAGVVVHTGSSVALASREAALCQVREALLPMLDVLPDAAPDLLLEPTAGQGESLCATIDDLEEYLAALDDHPRAKVCLDTCHAFAAGHDLSTPDGMTAALDRLVEVAGPGRLAAVHANDSLDVCGSFRDRHANIGEGRIGAEPFATLFSHPAVDGVPVVVETPGGSAAHAVDIATLKALRTNP